MNDDEIKLNEGFWWRNCKKSDIDVVYLTKEKKFAVVLGSENEIPELTINERDAIILRDAGINFTDEAVEQTKLIETNEKLANESFRRWLGD